MSRWECAASCGPSDRLQEVLPQVQLLNLMTREGYKLIRKKRDENLLFLDAIGRELKTDDDSLSSPVFSP